MLMKKRRDKVIITKHHRIPTPIRTEKRNTHEKGNRCIVNIFDYIY